MTAPEPYYSDDFVTLYHGDCLAALPLITADVDLLCADPPYGLDIGYGRTALGTRAIAGDATDTLLCGIYRSTEHLMRPDAWSAVFCGYSAVGKVQRQAGIVGHTVKTVIVWDKLMPSLGEGIRNQHEMIVLSRRGKPKESFAGGNVWRLNRERGRAPHPHMKPQALMTRLIDYYSPAGGTVLDPFSGSGSTLVAAKALGRKSIGIEVDEAYCELIAKRLAQGALDFGDGAA